jgi:5'-methylthioinosine phosphorylase
MIGIIGGTGLTEFAKGDICGERKTPYGETSGEIIRLLIDGQNVFFLARHGHPHTIPPHKVNYRANLWALKQLGVSRLLAVNAVGGITQPMIAGALVIPSQIIDYSYGREHTFSDGNNEKLEHIDFSYPFSAPLRQALIDTAAECSLTTIDQAVYGVTQGPRLETAAEIKRMRKDGCDIVGMTAMPEAALARELGIDYASICLVVNPAAGCSDQLITMADIHRVTDSGMEQIRQWLKVAIAALLSTT